MDTKAADVSGYWSWDIGDVVDHTSYRAQAYLQTLARRGVPKESNKAVEVGLPGALEVGAGLHLSLCGSSPQVTDS